MYFMESTFFSWLPEAAMATMGSKTLFLLTTAIIGAVLANPFAELRSNFEYLGTGSETNLAEPKYRLLDNVMPTMVYLDLDVYIDESRFNGLVQIEVQVLENLTQIVLHQKVVSISAVTVFDSNNNPVPLQAPNTFEIDSYFELLKINFDGVLTAGTYKIVISYLGQINENPLDRGFYKGYYYDNEGIKRYYATTQFQPYHARKAFPCFDEPQFKSKFVISITRDSSLSKSYSNMAIESTVNVGTTRVKETFYPTPNISPYLIAFHVSDFEETTETSTDDKHFGIVSRRGVTDQHSYAASIGVRITQELSDFTFFDYYVMGDGSPMKNDHIALPDFPSGAMENWGMVNYREAYLLYDDANTNMVNQIFIATIIAHEMAHKWFGNLVTCFWWSNLWLNESYASYFEYFAAHWADPSLGLDEMFVTDLVQGALVWDVGASATPMNWTGALDNDAISSHFSTTSYGKGASVLRMLEHFVGHNNFKNALSYYLRDNSYNVGTPEAMYDAFRLAASQDPSFAATYGDIDIGAVFDTWVQTPGSPVLKVNVNMDTGVIDVTQQRYQLSGTIPDSLWWIPVTWTHGGNPDFTDTKPKFVMTQRKVVLRKDPGHNWVIFNVAHSGLYRVNYDDHNWEMLAAALRGDDRERIHRLNRAHIVGDVLYFLRSNDITVKRAIDVLSFLQFETDYHVWVTALGQLDWIRRRLEHLPAAREVYTNWLLTLIDKAVDELGYEDRSTDSTRDILNRMQIMNFACNILHHEGCVEYSKQRWRQHRNTTNDLVPKNARRYIYCVGLREGDATDYEFLFQKYNSSQNTADMVVILRTLACTKDKFSLEHYLEQSLYNDRIRVHDRTNAFNYALQGNKENVKTVLEFVAYHYNEIIEHYGGRNRFETSLNALAGYLTDFQDIVEFQAWLYRNQVELSSSFSVGVNVVNSALNNLQWGNRMAFNIVSEIQENGFANFANSITVSVALFITTALVQLLK